MKHGQKTSNSVRSVVADIAELLSDVLWQTFLNLCQVCCERQSWTSVRCVVTDIAERLSGVLCQTVMNFCQMCCDGHLNLCQMCCDSDELMSDVLW